MTIESRERKVIDTDRSHRTFGTSGTPLAFLRSRFAAPPVVRAPTVEAPPPVADDLPPVEAPDPVAAATVADLRRHVADLSRDFAWREAWNRRHGSPDGWRSPVRVAGYMLDDFAAGKLDPDPDSLDAYLRRLLAGEFFERKTKK